MSIGGFEDLDKLEAHQAEIELLAKRSAEDGYRLFLRTSGILPNDDYKDSVIAFLIARAMGETGTNEVEALKNRLKGMDAATQQKWLDGCARFEQVKNASDLAILTELRKRLRKGKGAPFPLDYAGGVGYIASELFAAYLKLSPSDGAPLAVMPVAMPVPRGAYDTPEVSTLSQVNSEPRSVNINTEAKVREAHRLLKAGTKWSVVKRTCSHGTYIRWCYAITGEEPVTKR